LVVKKKSPEISIVEEGGRKKGKIKNQVNLHYLCTPHYQALGLFIK
jgi:hypothetical protein